MPEDASPRLIQVVCPDPARLLEHAAGGFLHAAPGADPFPSPAYLLVLRQGGLRDDLHALAAERGVPGWFDPPVAVFHELPQWLGSTPRRPLGDFERAALLEHLLRAHGGEVFTGREGVFLPSVERLFGELRAEAVTPVALEQAIGALPPREPFESRRDAAIAAVYRAYVDVLDREGRRDGRDTLADAAAALAADPAALATRLGGRRELRIVGLADTRGGWRLVLEALAASPAVERIALYVTCDLIPGAAVERLDGAPAPAECELLGELDDASELEAVAARVRRLVESGVTPDRIAVVSRDGRPHTDLALAALAQAGVPATARRRIRLLAVPAVRAVVALLDAAASGWTRHALAGLGAQPYFAAELDGRVINYMGYRRRIVGLAAWTVAFDALLSEAQAAEAATGEEEWRPRSLPVAWVERARQRFESFVGTVRPMNEARPLAAWLTWLEAWLDADPWGMEERMGRVPGDRWDVVRLDLLGWRQLRAIVEDWSQAEAAWPGDDAPLAAGAFVERLRIMLAGDVALWTETARGVVVAEALAASHRSFEHLFLVGMDAGRFPRRAPSSLLLGERDREALRAAGLPLETTAEWERREWALFETLVRGARRSLTLSHRRLDDLGGAANPSTFVETLSESVAFVARPVPAGGIAASPTLAAHAHRVALIERERATGRLSPWNGLIESADLRAWLEERYGAGFVWSPTSLEAYAKCPWSWFAERLLRVNVLEDPDEDMDAIVRGSVLHDALHRFYEAAKERVGGSVFLTAADEAWARPLLRAALRDALAAAEGTLWLGHPSLREVKYAELERMLHRFLAFELELNGKADNPGSPISRMVRTAVAAHEVRFEGVQLVRGPDTLTYRGVIDRIEVGVDPRVPGQWVAAVDYKTTKYAVPAQGKSAAWGDDVVLQVPLYAHALTQLYPGAAIARVEYRAVKQPDRLLSLGLVKVKKSGVEADDESVARMETALRAALRHAKRIAAGAFAAAPAPSCHCSPFCGAWDICRVKGGPDDGWE